jgi:fumarate hydratase class I
MCALCTYAYTHTHTHMFQVEVLEYAELGMEAIWKIEVVDFPAFIVVDDKGNDFFAEFNM